MESLAVEGLEQIVEGVHVEGTQGFEEFSTPVGGAMMAAFMRDLPLTRLIVALTPPEKWGDWRAQGLSREPSEWTSKARSA